MVICVALFVSFTLWCGVWFGHNNIRMLAVANMAEVQCLPASPPGTCLSIPSLSLMSPLTPFSDKCALVTPLFLLGLSLFIVFLTLSHCAGPITELGQLGPRGRRNYNWNESKYGAGGRFGDWFLFGGCVYIRALLFLWDWLIGTGDEGSSDQGGENLFACFGVAGDLKDEKKDVATKSRGHEKHVGVIGYDSSLGAHGPVVLAGIRASIFILVWCSVCTFLIEMHNEVSHWLMNFDGDVTFFRVDVNSHLVAVALHFLNGTQCILQACSHSFEDWFILPFSSSTTGMVVNTFLYAKAFIVVTELALFILGVILDVTGIYLPKGVSHPGGPRPHKIMRVPKWTEGRTHVLPNEILINKNGKWRCAVAHDAHRDTIAKFNEAKTRGNLNEVKATLSGEPFGRQMWTMKESQPRIDSIETEDDLNSTLKKKFKREITSKCELNERQNNSKENEPNLFQQIGDFFNNTPKKNQAKSKEANQSNLVRHLASGGRDPMKFDPSKNVNSCDQIFRAQMISSYLDENGLPEEMAHLQAGDGSEKNTPVQNVNEAARRGVAFYSMLQTSDGHWGGDYGGPHFLMPGLIVAWYIMGKPALMISSSQQQLMLHYLKVHQQEDGGWGTHIESPSTMFGTVICYLAVRLLGAEKNEDWIVKGREFILKEGGAVMTSSWAKFWLCLIGCMDWKGE